MHAVQNTHMVNNTNAGRDGQFARVSRPNSEEGERIRTPQA